MKKPLRSQFIFATLIGIILVFGPIGFISLKRMDYQSAIPSKIPLEDLLGHRGDTMRSYGEWFHGGGASFGRKEHLAHAKRVGREKVRPISPLVPGIRFFKGVELPYEWPVGSDKGNARFNFTIGTQF